MKFFGHKNGSKIIYELCRIGSAGQGKSTLTQFISQLFRAFFLNVNTINTPANVNLFLKKFHERKAKIISPILIRIPFRIILTDYSDWITRQKKEHNPTNILSYIKSEIESDGDKIEIEALRNLFSNLSLFIIFDGLDEIPASANRNIIVTEIDNFIDIELHQQNSDAIIMITTRPQGFKDEFSNEKFIHLKIVELSKATCLEYLETLLEKTTQKKSKKDKQLNILKRALENEASARLMRTPLDATIMATLVKRGGNPPEVKYNLYKEYYTTIFDREREKQVFELDKYKIAINSLHEYLGFILQSSSEQKDKITKITHGSFKKTIKEYFIKQEFTKAEAIENTETISKVLTNRLVMITELTADLDNPDNNIIGFPVAPIQEYFASLFIINEEEKIVIERIKKISSNSYWRNVLLFVIGYFQNERRQHLIDNIYTAFKQDNLVDEMSKVGSWLAIDILIENIFSEVPKYEKLFAKELDEVLNLSFSDKLNYLLRMPEVSINKYLKESINSKLYSNKTFIQKMPSWYIAIQIPSIFQEIIAKYWPNGNEEIELLKLIIKERKLNRDFFIKKALHRLNDLLKDDSTFDIEYFIAILSGHPQLKEEDIKLIIEFLFLSNDHISDNIKLIFQIVEKKKIEIKSHIEHFKNPSNPDQRELHLLKQDTKENIKLNNIFKKYNLKYLAKLLEFYISPSKLTLNQYIINLKNLDEKKFTKVRSIHKSWILSYAFENINKKTDLPKRLKFINSDNFGDIKQWQQLENQIIDNPMSNPEVKDIYFKYSRSSGNSRNLINEYEGFYKPIIFDDTINSYPNLQREFILKYLTSTFNDSSIFSNNEEKKSNKSYSIITDLLKILNTNEIKFNNTNLNIYQLFLNSLTCIIHK